MTGKSVSAGHEVGGMPPTGHSTNWRSLRSPQIAHLASIDGVAIQPVGAYEQHGRHLPLATDAIIAEALAAGAAELLVPRVNPWVLPTLAYGKSIEHQGFAGTISLSTTTFLAVCIDIARSVAASGIRTLVFVNAHGGNPEALQLVIRDIAAELPLTAYTVHAPSLSLPVGLVEQMPRSDIDVHAGFYETSIMLALAEADVAIDEAAPDGLDVVDELAKLTRVSLFGHVGLPWSTNQLSRSGTIGDPTGADAAWGRSALAHQRAELAEVIAEFAGLDLPALKGEHGAAASATPVGRLGSSSPAAPPAR